MILDTGFSKTKMSKAILLHMNMLVNAAVMQVEFYEPQRAGEPNLYVRCYKQC